MRRELVVAGIGAVVVAALVLGRPRRQADMTHVDNTQINPVWGGHRGRSAAYGGDVPSVRMGSAQDHHPSEDFGAYPYRNTMPSSYAQGYWRGKATQMVGYSPLDYGDVPQRIPHLWKDATRYWDGLQQRGYTQQSYRLHLFHLRPSMPTRGYRSVSGVMTRTGPTASRARIPAVFIPSSVS